MSIKIILISLGLHGADTGQLPALHTLAADQVVSVTPLRSDQTVTVDCKDGSRYVYGRADWDLEDTFSTTAPEIVKAIAKVKMVFALAEVAPHFPGGDTAWANYIRAFCEKHREEIGGDTVAIFTVQFVVHFKGQVTDVQLYNPNTYGKNLPSGEAESPHSRMQDLAIEALKESPPWLPALPLR